MDKFQVGDRVEVIRKRHPQPIGACGTVISLSGPYVRVAFDNPWQNNDNHFTNGLYWDNLKALPKITFADEAAYLEAITDG